MLKAPRSLTAAAFPHAQRADLFCEPAVFTPAEVSTVIRVTRLIKEFSEGKDTLVVRRHFSDGATSCRGRVKVPVGAPIR